MSAGRRLRAYLAFDGLALPDMARTWVAGAGEVFGGMQMGTIQLALKWSKEKSNGDRVR